MLFRDEYASKESMTNVEVHEQWRAHPETQSRPSSAGPVGVSELRLPRISFRA